MKRGLIAAGAAVTILAIVVVLMAVPKGGLLQRERRTQALRLAYRRDAGIHARGIAYGMSTSQSERSRRGPDDVGNDGHDGNYIVLAFFAAQALALFEWSRLAPILAVEGANLLKKAHLHDGPLFIGVILITAMINLLMSSASAKWTMMAPVFVPMMMVLGYAPETTQALYRVGDSVATSSAIEFYPSIIVPLCAI
jgi:aminobenzoyl-glutamate transport protein